MKRSGQTPAPKATGFAAIIATAKKRALVLLRDVGIKDSFTVKIHLTKGSGADALGWYRSMSQFRGGAIFWISPTLPQMASAQGVEDQIDLIVLDTLLHEYGHVIWEFAKKNHNAKSLWDKVQEVTAGNEEEFAEMFAHNIRRKYGGSFTEIARLHGRLLAAK
jgi:hypothetical protein